MPHPWLVRLATVAVATATAVGATLVNAAPAQAECCAIRVIQVPCPWWAGGAITTYYNPFNVVSVEPGFLIAEGRVAVNDLEYPITVTFTNTVTTTFTLNASIGASARLTEWLTVTVSSAITSATAVAIGISTTASVPAFSRVYGDYGVESFNVTFDAEYVFRRAAIGGCWIREYDGGITRASASAPTYRQGWRVYEG